MSSRSMDAARAASDAWTAATGESEGGKDVVSTRVRGRRWRVDSKATPASTQRSETPQPGGGHQACSARQAYRVCGRAVLLGVHRVGRRTRTGSHRCATCINHGQIVGLRNSGCGSGCAGVCVCVWGGARAVQGLPHTGMHVRRETEHRAGVHAAHDRRNRGLVTTCQQRPPGV